jgi:hypothetical protein
MIENGGIKTTVKTESLIEMGDQNFGGIQSEPIDPQKLSAERFISDSLKYRLSSDEIDGVPDTHENLETDRTLCNSIDVKR